MGVGGEGCVKSTLKSRRFDLLRDHIQHQLPLLAFTRRILSNLPSENFLPVQTDRGKIAGEFTRLNY